MIPMFAESFSVKTDAFEGPLELLLDLIEKRKLHISDISLAKVTDDFIAHIRDQSNFPLGLSAHFVLVASTLLLIKSKSLLPAIDLTEEEEQSIEDLERRLREYKRMKELSLHVRELFGKRVIFAPAQRPKQKIVFAPDGSMRLEAVRLGAMAVVAGFPKKEAKPELMLKKVVSLEETIEKLTERITKSFRMSFREFSGHSSSKLDYEKKVEVIVGFLAMLELAKQGIIAVSQSDRFGDIHMETESVGLPRYD